MLSYCSQPLTLGTQLPGFLYSHLLPNFLSYPFSWQNWLYKLVEDFLSTRFCFAPKFCCLTVPPMQPAVWPSFFFFFQHLQHHSCSGCAFIPSFIVSLWHALHWVWSFIVFPLGWILHLALHIALLSRRLLLGCFVLLLVFTNPTLVLFLPFCFDGIFFMQSSEWPCNLCHLFLFYSISFWNSFFFTVCSTFHALFCSILPSRVSWWQVLGVVFPFALVLFHPL